jgi:hypothetical protein
VAHTDESEPLTVSTTALKPWRARCRRRSSLPECLKKDVLFQIEAGYIADTVRAFIAKAAEKL